MKLPRFISISLILSLVLAISSVQAVPRQLAHFRTTGETTAYTVKMHASVPTQGEMDSLATVTERALTSEGDGFHAEADQSVDGQGFPSAETSATYRVSADGQMSELVSDELDHPVDGAYTKNLALLYVALPEDPADIGDQWTAVRTLYTPKMDTPVQLPPIKLDIKLTLAAIEGPADSPIARVDVTAKQAAGQSTQASFSGVYLFDVNRGRVLSGDLSGTLKVKVFFSRITVPISVEIREGNEDELRAVQAD